MAIIAPRYLSSLVNLWVNLISMNETLLQKSVLANTRHSFDTEVHNPADYSINRNTGGYITLTVSFSILNPVWFSVSNSVYELIVKLSNARIRTIND